MESGACDFLVAKKIQAASYSLGERNALLARVFDIRPDNFLDRQIAGIDSNLRRFFVYQKIMAVHIADYDSKIGFVCVEQPTISGISLATPDP